MNGDPVERVLAAINAGELEAFVACYQPAATVEDGADTVLASGHDQLRARYGAMFEQYPQLRVASLSRIDVGPYVVSEEWVVGRSAEVERHVAVYTIEDSLIARERLLRA
jgi:hypothetical protein